MQLINFTHPLTPEHCARIEHLSGRAIERLINVKTQLDHEQPFVEQARQAVATVGLCPDEWQTVPLLVNLPGLSAIAALMLAELHGRCGYFPAVLRLKPIPQTTPPRFEVAEILNLQIVREAARQQR